MLEIGDRVLVTKRGKWFTRTMEKCIGNVCTICCITNTGAFNLKETELPFIFGEDSLLKVTTMDNITEEELVKQYYKSIEKEV